MIAIVSLSVAGLEVYPNPTTDKLTIAINQIGYLENSISVYNNLGQRISVAATMVDHAIIADFSHLNNGLYFLQVYGKDGKLYQGKIIKN